jgi:predicted GNAT family acetyltransferase
MPDELSLDFQNDADRHRFEAMSAGKVAGFVEYNVLSQSIMLTHTEVAQEFEGKGVGGFLARESLVAARAMGKRVIPACPFIASWLRKHRDFLDLVEPDVQRAYKI